MDKNMDNDLSDIMKEIEALEQDFKNEEKAFAKSPIIQELAQLSEELSAPVGQTKSDDTFAWLQGDNNTAEPLDVSEAEIFEMKAQPVAAPSCEVEAPAPVAAPVQEAPVAQAAPEAEVPVATVSPIASAPKVQPKEWKETPAAYSSPKMTFKLPEGRPVHFEFQRGTECLNFSWTEEGFQVEVESGMSFTIPYSQLKKAA